MPEAIVPQRGRGQVSPLPSAAGAAGPGEVDGGGGQDHRKHCGEMVSREVREAGRGESEKPSVEDCESRTEAPRTRIHKPFQASHVHPPLATVTPGGPSQLPG